MKERLPVLTSATDAILYTLKGDDGKHGNNDIGDLTEVLLRIFLTLFSTEGHQTNSLPTSLQLPSCILFNDGKHCSNNIVDLPFVVL